MRRILLIFKNDVKRRMKAPWVILIMLLIPMFMTGIMGAIFAPKDDGGALPRIKVLLVDKDKNTASKILLGAFDNEEMKDMFEITVVEEKRGLKLIASGKASALVIIPEKFTEKLLNMETNTLTVIKNPSEQFLPMVVEEFMNTLSVLVSGLLQVFEPEVRAIKMATEMPLEDFSMAGALPFMEAAKDKIVALKAYLSPLLLELKTVVPKEESKKEEEDKPGFNLFGFLLPSMAILFLLFIIETFMRDILSEREDGKLQRMMFAPLRTMEFILARVLSGWFMGIAVYVVVVVGGVLIFGIDWGNYLYLFILVAVTCFWCASFFALLNGFFKNKNQSGAILAPIILVFSAFGGSMLPVNQLPDSMQFIANFTLNHWFITGSAEIIDGQFPGLNIAVILGTALVMFIAAALVLRRRLTV